MDNIPFAPTEETMPMRRHRTTKTLAAALAAVVLLAVAGAAALWWYGDRQVGSLDVETAVPGDTDGDGTVDAPELQDVVNVLVVGSDSRDELTAEQRKELGTGDFEGNRTDTVMVVQVDPEREAPAVLSFPRDLLVERCDGTEGRINEAFAIGEADGSGGPACLIRTITGLTGIPIHHYMQMDFLGFVDVVDALGGVPMCLGRPLADPDANIDLQAGCQTLSGKEALGFVRARKVDSDLGRIQRQQRFLGAVAGRALSPEIALNPVRAKRLIDTGSQAVQADDGLSVGLMRSMASTFDGADGSSMDMRTVPTVDQMIDGVAYLVAQEQAAEQLYAAFRAARSAPKGIGVDATQDTGEDSG